MNLNVVTSGTLYEATKETIKKIDIKNLGQKNLVVVPDSFSMQAENLIFDVLNVKSTFNISVVGISRLAGKILREHNFPFERISGLEEVLLTYKSVKENEENFTYFKNYGIDFCLKVKEILSQFSNCFVKVEDIKPCENKILSRKMEDLKKIYSSYLQNIEGKLNLSKLLSFFLEKSEFMDLRNYNLYFVNFDSFSKEIFDFICNLSKKVNKVFLSVAKPIWQGNAYIYENDTLKKMMDYANSVGVKINVEEKKFDNKDKLPILKNVFSMQYDKQNSEMFSSIVASDKTDEVEFVAKHIYYHITKGKRYKNFSIAVADPSYFKIIDSVFEKYDIPHYMDYNLTLNEIGITKFFLKILEMAQNGVGQVDIEYLLSSPLMRIENAEEKINRVKYYEIDNEREFSKEDSSLDEIFEIIKNIKKSEKIQNLCENSQKIIEKIEKNTDFYLGKIISLQKKQENDQAISLIKKTLSEIANFSFAENMNLKDFLFLLKTVFESVKVETVPSYIDAVFVGDATKSYFEDVDTLFIVGATSSLLPKTEKDCGIILDDELEQIGHLIEPEIRVINRRNRLKLYELLQHANISLITICSLSSGEKKSEFVNDLEKALGVKENTTSSYLNFSRTDLDEEGFQNLVQFSLGGRKVFETNFKKIEKKLPQNYINSLNSLVKNEFFSYDYNFLNFNPLKNKISASRLETYFVCPFKHFLRYIANVKEEDFARQDKRKVGILKHEILKLFVQEFKNLREVKEEEIEKFLNENFLTSFKNTFDEVLLRDEIFMKILKRECFNMLSNVVYEQQKSDFRPIFTEQIVKNSISNYEFVGFVDRIDRYKNYFRIIDYKTGKVDAVLKDLFYGKKLQLFLYAKFVKESLKLDISGVYYFDCKNKFKKKNVFTKLLDGITLKNNDVVYATDYKFMEENYKSDIIGGTRKKEPKKDEFVVKYGNFVNSFDKYLYYALKVSENAICEIEKGYIAPKPIEKECEKCKFKSICKFNGDGFRKQFVKKDF